MKLSGIEIRNFRSIGNDPVILTPWKKCNILIGQNNSGKSNVIRAVEKIANAFYVREPRANALIANLDRQDIHRLDMEQEFSFSLYVTGESDIPNDKELMDFVGDAEHHITFLKRRTEQGLIIIDHSLMSIQNFEVANKLLYAATGSHWGGRVAKPIILKEFTENAYRYFYRYFNSSFPSVKMIPVFRQIRPGEEYNLNGEFLIQLLGQYQHPRPGNDAERQKFEKIQDFVRRLLHLPKATLEVTHDNQQLVITNDGLRLELNSYGTGVHELIILATAILSIENSICCIEEPEIHLHPALQREFIRFIVKETNNQYLISTHSPTFINAHVNMPSDIADQIQVFHIQLRDGATLGYPVLDGTQSLVALNDLGVRASDILQTNCVIWVEGPSDRVFLNHWLRLVKPELIEGLHYSIMFYGGRLLAHLSVNRKKSAATESVDKVPEELIEVLKINQNAIVLMDSDKTASRSQINKTKRRVRTECEDSQGYPWVTDGREIENYVPVEVLAATFPGLAGSLTAFGNYDKIDDALQRACAKSRIKQITYGSDKVKYARQIVEHFEEHHISGELQRHLDKTVSKILEWNS